ncbi:MAG: serine/threonine-protein kinase [Acidobacteriota bacterium]|nr:serine/threonine-protein kinase [Acidobacteriota bacterium]
MAPPAPPWEELRELFRQALELPEDEWPTFLDSVPKTDGLRAELRSLLEAHRRSDGFLEPTAEAASSPFPGPRQDSTAGAARGHPPHRGTDPLEGRVLGTYRLVYRLESGGMGSVYLAVRADDEYQQRVAVKILREGRISDELIARFRNERQILAALDHPLVAKLLDGGTTREGLPYLVMEYIEGEPIDEYCARRQLSLGQRIDLFRKVCSAVQFAHQNLVIHRDLKPANILITADGTPKLLDFGIAKLLNPELFAASPDATSKVRLLTPTYASPEQILGHPVSTAADVYSLGVVLYLLLTGRSPYTSTAESPTKLARWITSVKVLKPSERVLQDSREASEALPSTDTRSIQRRPVTARRRRISRKLRGDLDAIALKALAKEPRHRYASVEALSDDLGRAADHYPVQARPANPLYRCARFLRRNRLATTLATGFVVAILGFSLLMALQRSELIRERDRAEQVKTLLMDLFQVSDPLLTSADQLSARDILDEGERRLRSRQTLEPETRAELLDTLGVIYLRLGELERANEILSSSLRIRIAQSGERSLETARTLNFLAEARLEEGKFEQAIPHLEKALAIRRRELGPTSLQVGETLNDLAKAMHYGGDLEAAERRYREALEIRETALSGSHPEIAETLNNLAIALWQQGKSAQAEPLHRRALDMRRRLLGAEHIEVSESLNNLAALLAGLGRYEEAQTHYEQALSLRRQILGPSHPRVGNTQNNLGGVLLARGDIEVADQHYRQALEVYRASFGETHPRTARVLCNLGRVREQARDFPQAERLYRGAISTFRQTLPPAHPDLAWCLCQLAGVLIAEQDFASAEPLAQEALSILEQKLPADHWRLAEAQSLVGVCRAARGEREAAEPLLTQSVKILAAKPTHEAQSRARVAEAFLGPAQPAAEGEH